MDVYRNCPDFQYQITECLTLIFSMSAARSGMDAPQTQNYKEFAKHPQTMTVFFTCPINIYHFSSFRIYD